MHVAWVMIERNATPPYVENHWHSASTWPVKWLNTSPALLSMQAKYKKTIYGLSAPPPDWLCARGQQILLMPRARHLSPTGHGPTHTLDLHDLARILFSGLHPLSNGVPVVHVDTPTWSKYSQHANSAEAVTHRVMLCHHLMLQYMS